MSWFFKFPEVQKEVTYFSSLEKLLEHESVKIIILLMKRIKHNCKKYILINYRNTIL